MPENDDKTIKLKPEELDAAPASRKNSATTVDALELGAKIKSITSSFRAKRDIDASLERTAMDLGHGRSGEIDLEETGVPPSAHFNERYKVLEQLAEGGHGLLDIAKDIQLNRLVAVKSIRPEYANDGKIVESFLGEARLTAQLEHPSVAPIYSLERDAECGAMHLAMKLIRGRTLKDYLSQIVKSYQVEGAFSFDERKSLSFRLDIFLRVCDALAYAHSRNVMHCDLKPENVMIGEYRETYLMDWGIARLIDEPGYDPAKWIKPKTISGTPKYLSPEAIDGAHTDQRADIFALGLILFEMATLKSAVAGSDPLEVMTKIRNGDFEPLRHKFGHPLDRDLKAIIRKAMAVDRERRYASVSELSEDIRRMLRFEEVKANPDGALMKCVRLLYTHRLVFASVMAAALLLGASGLAIAFYERMNSIETTREREAAVNLAHSKTMDAAFAIDRMTSHIENSLWTVASEAAFLLRVDHNAPAERYYSYSDLSSPKTAPPDLSYSPVYKMKISPGEFVYKTPPGMDKAEAMETLRRIAPIGRRFEFILLDSQGGARTLHSKLREALTTLLDKGYPARWIYMGLSNGFLVSYPGKDSYPPNYDPRLRPWYMAGMKADRPFWGDPYIDTGGQGIVIPCLTPIIDYEDKRHGVIGMDVAFDYIVDHMMRRGNTAPYVVAKYLVDKDGKVVVGTDSKFAGLSFRPGTIVNDVPELPPFPEKELLRKMREERFGSLLANGIAGTRLFSFALVNSLNAIYIEELDFKRVLEGYAPKKGQTIAPQAPSIP